MSSKLNLHLENTLVYESTSLELILAESFSKEAYLKIFCEENDLYLLKEVFIDFEKRHLLIIKIYSYGQ